MHGFCIFSGWGVGGGGSDPRIPYSGVRREYMVFSVFWPYSVRILPNHRIRRIRIEYGPCILVDRIPRILYVFCVFSSGGQNTVFCQKNRIRTEYGQNTVITKSPIVITNSTPPGGGRGPGHTPGLTSWSSMCVGQSCPRG